MYDDILTVEEAAKLLKVAPEIVLNLLMSGELPGRNVGGEWRTTKRALVSFVDGVALQRGCCAPDGCCGTCPMGAVQGCRGMPGPSGA